MISLEPASLFAATERRLGSRYRLERLVAASLERVLFVGRDTLLNRRVSIRVNFSGNDQLRVWFLREAEALGQLDHPAIRHAYDVGVVDDMAFRIGNWIEAESLQIAVTRGPRPIPQVHVLARDLLRGMEHAHANGIILRRVVPSSVLVSATGRATITDVRFCSYVLPFIPPTERPSSPHFMAPEVRDGSMGDVMADVYAAGAVIYYALTGVEPDEDPTRVEPASSIRHASPQLLDRILMRAMQPQPNARFMSVSEMLEDFASEAGAYTTASTLDATPQAVSEAPREWEKRIRRAFGDDYELLGEIGSGGFGRVYRVRDLHLERVVALKLLHPSLTQDPAGLERFRQEAQLAARVNHPNIVNIYEIGGRSGLLWYTMELIDGPNLAQLVEREGPLDADRVVALLREALGALAHAHASGLVHRDIKPENLLIDRTGRLRITDFGLAVALLGQGRFGGASSRSGTPQFASPEQLLGDQIDHRSDLYSLAAVGYYALLGYPPFSGNRPEVVLAKQTMNRLPDLETEQPDVGSGLAGVLRLAIQADKNARYQSAAEFLHALNRAARRDQRARSKFWWQKGLARLYEPYRPKS